MAKVKANVNVRIDADVKILAANLLERMGIDQTTAIDMFYRQIIAERRLPFRPAVSPSLDEQLVSALEKTPAKEYTPDTGDNGEIKTDRGIIKPG